MRFDLVVPCRDCPFRCDISGYLGEGRAEEIATAVVDEDKTFACHKTLDLPEIDHQHCAGALLLHEATGRRNWRIRFAHRLGLYDPDRLKRTVAVLDSAAAFITHHTGY